MTTELHDNNASGQPLGLGSSEGLGAGSETQFQTDGYFSRSMLEKAVMTPQQVASVSEGRCPKCLHQLARVANGGGLRFSKCTGCGDVWVTEAPNEPVQRPA